SAFFVFCGEYRPSVKQQYPGLSIGDCAKKLGEMWSKLTQADKLPYEEKAQKLREKYDRRSEHFLENSAKLTDCSGFFLRCSSLHVWTKNAMGSESRAGRRLGPGPGPGSLRDELRSPAVNG
ncbi:hypothetical protein CRUP_002038, partial [Coryphaenoides rupestris]